MKIGIIGAGAIGTAIARALSKAGIEVAIANSRGPDSLQSLVDELGPKVIAVSREQAAQADIVFLAVNWSKIPAALENLSPWNGRIVVDANNPIEAPTFRPFDLGGESSSEVVARMLPGARLVKAFNHLQPALLSGDPTAEGGRRVLFYSGEDAEAKVEVAQLIERLGFAGIDLGGLSEGRLAQFPGGPLPALNLVKHG
ncbi:NADP oxidoreductase [Pseudomonas aeruginosa]|uniref:NADPH-dependent F420 reductase n=1 Tax=Pseudomonas TaxID=286 RepID=UPI00137B2D45|nr:MULTISPECIES: NADPH-dependent F420 reductase [Pseudomonas]MCE7776433.1 NADP oxidoreductase [Pseudomonas aeruginosa]HCL4016241.1 NADPH-dependent F420 reductase [Pseudomonas aeruginosa]